MITIKLVGGAKKSLSTDKLIVDEDNISIQQLLNHLLKIKPKNTPDFDTNNLLVAVNGVDSSALEGKSTKLHSNDIVSIIPVIHGGLTDRIKLKISNSLVEIIKISSLNKFDENFLHDMRKKFPTLVIQGVSSNYILSILHIKKIIAISLKAKKNQTLLAKKLETDILMRFASTTQISKAIETVGIKPGMEFFIVAIGRESILDKLYSKLKPLLNSKNVSKDNQNFLKKHFKISQKQMNAISSRSALEDLIVERAAILIR